MANFRPKGKMRLAAVALATWAGLVFVPCPGLASNGHEHLQYLMSFEDLVSAGVHPESMDAFAALGAGVRVRRVIGNEAALRLLRGAHMPQYSPTMTEAQMDSALNELLKKNSLGSLAKLISESNPGNSAAEVLRCFFELHSLHGVQPASDVSEAYSAIGVLRSNVLNAEKSKLPQIMDAYMRRVPALSRRGLEVTVPPGLYEKDLLQSIRKIFQNHGADGNFYLAMGRSGRSNNQDGHALEMLQRSIREGWGQGADFVGSAFESLPGQPLSEAEKANRSMETLARLETVSNAVGHGGILRLHAFEGAREGPFYTAFWQFMESHAKNGSLPKEIHIGHINMLSAEDIAHFTRLREQIHSTYPGIEIVFDANIESNLVLQSKGDTGAHLKNLVQTIEVLQNAKFKVVLGSDGQGILGAASQWSETMQTLFKAGLSKASAAKLVASASLHPDEKEAFMTRLMSTATEPAPECWMQRAAAVIQ